MKCCNPQKQHDLFSMIEHPQEVMRTASGINEFNSVIDRESFRSALESLLGYDVRDPWQGGRLLMPY